MTLMVAKDFLPSMMNIVVSNLNRTTLSTSQFAYFNQANENTEIVTMNAIMSLYQSVYFD